MADITKTKWNSEGLGVKSAVCTPHDTEAREFDLLYIGGDAADPSAVGNLKAKLRDDSDWQTWYNLLPGEFPHSVKAVHTDTTCQNILGINKDKG